MATESKQQLEKVPTHLGFIMDGNGRWAAERGLPRLAGHRAGKLPLVDGLGAGPRRAHPEPEHGAQRNGEEPSAWVHQRLRSDRLDLLCDDRVTVPLQIDAGEGG